MAGEGFSSTAARQATAATPLAEPWWALEAAETLRLADSRPEGLSEQQASRRRPPIPRSGGRRRLLVLGELAESLAEPLQLLLIGVAILQAIWGELRDAIAIAAVIAAVAGLETATELRAKRALAGLRVLAAPTARLLRAGRLADRPAEEVVVGDVVVVEVGDRVPADCRVIWAAGLAADESALTGEPAAAAKSAALVAAKVALAERSSMLWAGTVVVAGEGRAVVVATGPDSELGRLGRLVESAREPATALQRGMGELARAVLMVAVAASVLVPLVGVVRGQPLRQMLLAGLTLAFATIPEELPILVTVLLAVGGRRLARRGALLRRLRAAETLGGVTVVVTDKTGTLTQNRLELAAVDGDRARVLGVARATQPPPTALPAGSAGAVETAIAEAALRVGVVPPGEQVAVFPFDPQRRRVSRAWRLDPGAASASARVRVAVKGAPEAVVAVCRLSEAERAEIAQRVDNLAGRGLRVLAVAEATVARVPGSAQQAERDLAFVGLLGFDDPLRPGVPEAVTALAGAGVRTVVVTGDHGRTAAAVAARAGVPAERVLLGGEGLARLDERALAGWLERDRVVARATPADKLRIVQTLQAAGEVVAVTGDGVNDAAALRAADVGVAMGRRGTDLAREAADLVLTDDAYPTIAAAVAGGRTIGSQLRRAVAFYLGAKLGLVLAMLVPLAVGLAAPFRPVQLVLLELFMDLGASVAFVAEPPTPGVMRRPPRDPARRFLDHTEVGAIAACGLALFAATCGSYLLLAGQLGTAAASTAAMATWLMGHAGVAWTLRARPSLPPRANLAFPGWALAALGVGILLAATPLGGALGLAGLPAASWLVVVAGVGVGVGLAAVGRQLTRAQTDL